MLSRFLLNPSRHFRLFSKPLSHPHPHPHPHPPTPRIPNYGITHLISRHFSGNSNNDGNKPNGEKPTPGIWKIAPENEDFGALFGTQDGDLSGINEVDNGEKESNLSEQSEVGEDVFERIKPWSFGEDEKLENVFDTGDVIRAGKGEGGVVKVIEEKEKENPVDVLQLQREEQGLLAVLKGPNRAFGDLVAASGITDAMLDSLIALKDFSKVDGLPPLTEIEDKRYENSLKKSSRYEMELQKQEEAAKARVRTVDEKGRAYGTGRRKCSIARVWIEPGAGKFLINDKEFDVYFPMLDHRAALLRPLAETKTLGLWDVKCTVKGGGTTGQVGAIRLGISRALQNWEPGLRPPLREAGFLSRDPRVVERKKPGKAKARKSFQWVKR